MTDVVVVIIGYNEGRYLGRCLSSAINACAFAKSLSITTEIVYVDSFSTDNSASLAKNAGISLIHPPKGFQTCGNARNAGVAATDSKYVMFLDGDMEVAPGWLVAALKFMEGLPVAAGVAGLRDDNRFIGEAYLTIHNYHNVRHEVEVVGSDIGGAFLYRRNALNQVGGFEPMVAPEEDYFLYCELKVRGWELYRINHPMITHWDYKISSPTRILSHLLLNGRATVPGVIFRHAVLSTKWWWLYLLKFQFPLICHLLWGAFLVGSMIAPGIHPVVKRDILLLITTLYILVIYFQKRDFLRTIAALFLRSGYLLNFFRGVVFNRPKLIFGVQNTPEYRNMLRFGN